MKTDQTVHLHESWNKGKLVGQKAPLKLKDIWSIRVRHQLSNRVRDLALFDLAIDSKLRACDLTKLKVRDIAHGSQISTRAIIMQQKTHNPVQFEITEATRTALTKWIENQAPRRKRTGYELRPPSCWLSPAYAPRGGELIPERLNTCNQKIICSAVEFTNQAIFQHDSTHVSSTSGFLRLAFIQAIMGRIQCGAQKRR